MYAACRFGYSLTYMKTSSGAIPKLSTSTAAVALSASVMALATLAVLEWAPGDSVRAGTASIGGTMAFNTFVLFQFFNILNARHDTRTVFHRDTLANRWLWIALGGVLLLPIGVTHLGFLQRLFDTMPISLGQWAICIAVASSVLWVEEIRKFIARKDPS